MPPHAEAGRRRLASVGQVEQLFIGSAVGQRLEAGGNLARRSGEHDGSPDRPLELCKIGLGLGVKVDDLRRERAIGGGRPRLGESDQRNALRLDDLGREPLERPALAERSPGLKVGVGQTPLGQGLTGPLTGPLEVG